MRAWSTGLALTLGLALLVGGSLAEASQSPPGCTNNGVALDLQKSVSDLIANGDTVTYTVVLGNGAGASCDAGNIVIRGFCPDTSGNPTILKTTFATIPNLPAPTADFIVGTFDCVVTVNAGVIFAQAKDTLTGVLHDSPVTDDPMEISKTVSVNLEVTPPPPPPPNQIPTLSEWVMIMFAVFLVLAGGVALRRKRIA
jgi:hypothetical protein